MEQLYFLWEAIKWIAVWFVIVVLMSYACCITFIFVKGTHAWLYKHFPFYKAIWELIDALADIS